MEKLWSGGKFTRAISNPMLAIAFVQKKFNDAFYLILWLCLSPVFRRISRIQGISPILRTRKIERAYFIEPGKNNRLTRERDAVSVSGPRLFTPELSNLAKDWLSQTLDVEVKSANFAFAKSPDQETEGIVFATYVSPTLDGPAKLIYFSHVIRLSYSLRKRGIPVIAFLPDLHYPDAAIVASALASITGGITGFLQNTSIEAVKYGYPNVVDRLFWPWPNSRLALGRDFLPWNSRTDRAVLPANNTGGKLRELSVQKFKRDLLAGGRFAEATTGGGLEPSKYLDLMAQSKICMTTNLTPEGFFILGNLAKLRLPRTYTTGRVWEAFLTGVTLVANETEVLLKLGFTPGVHYISLDNLEKHGTSINTHSDEELKNIAWMGFQRFREVVGWTPALIPEA